MNDTKGLKASRGRVTHRFNSTSKPLNTYGLSQNMEHARAHTYTHTHTLYGGQFTAKGNEGNDTAKKYVTVD